MGALAIYGTFFHVTQPYYSRHPVEPPPLTTPTFNVTDFAPASSEQLTLEQVLDAIIAHSATDILIVSHGAGNGINLNVDIAPLLQDIIIEMNNELCGRAPQDLPYTPSGGRHSHLVHISSGLLGKVRQVRALNLNRVVIRACKVGNDRALLDTLASLLNCRSINAPLLKSVFAITQPARLSTSAFDTWMHARRTHRQVDGQPGSRVGFEIIVDDQHHTVVFNLRVEAADETTGLATLRDWANRKFLFPDTSFFTFSSQTLPIECLYNESSRDAYFPKDPEYVANTATVTPSITNWCAPISIGDGSIPLN